MSIDLKALALACGLTEKEWIHFRETLKRDPSPTEIQMIGVMWSEHCSYKSSKRFLRQLRTHSEAVLQGPGENAGLVSLDDKRAIAFKIESHNHPSFVEPFQGAATGVGGILRDIFTMGARPIALGNYLRFGDFRNDSKHRLLLEGVVSGIAHYGNCMGIPTTGGHISTNKCYSGNILVNVFALGVVDRAKIFKSASAAPGCSVMIWGARTGRDGIHGASLLASADFESSKTQTKEQKIRVQVGDPFKEKTLMEATLEVMDQLSDKLIAIQDMGAAGLTCSTMEISFKSNVGMRVDLNQVPMREEGMQPFELLLSESQERMLAVVQKGSEAAFRKIIFDKWGCECAVIGETIPGDRLEMFFNGEKVVDLPVMEIQDPPPADLPEPAWVNPTVNLNAPTPSDVKKELEVLQLLLKHPSIASKKNVFERYDSTVGASTVLGPGHDAAVIWADEEGKGNRGIAFKGVADEDHYQIDPLYGAQSALLKGIRALACVGAKAIAYSDGVNLGNPTTPKVQGALERTVKGLNLAAEVFDTPCISGNVSLYNQTKTDGVSRDIFPTTFVMTVGALDDVRLARPSIFQKAGSEVWMVDIHEPSSVETLPGGSAYARIILEDANLAAHLPPIDLSGEKRLQNALLSAQASQLFLSCREVSQGGLAVALAKACFKENGQVWGFDGDLSKSQSRRDTLLFGEQQGRVIVEIDASNRALLMKLGMDFKLQLKRLGTVAKEPVYRVRPSLSGATDELREIWESVF